MSNLKFEELEISKEILKSIKEKGYEEATSIQSEAIPLIRDGRDIIGQSQTGTGKTAAFGIPIIEKIDKNLKTPQTIILCPTRELCLQVAEEIKDLAKYVDGVKIVAIYGGQPIDRQIMALRKGANIIVGTPGRVMDHLRRRTVKTNDISTMVLDEGDEMLNMGFEEDIVTILKEIKNERQTIIFSATMSNKILNITKKYQKNPIHLKITPKQITVLNIEQKYFEVKSNNKLEALTKLLDVYDPKLTVVFCNTKRKVDDLVENLGTRGYEADGIHGDLKQQQRDKVMKKFRTGAIEILVATDVAARGIDVDGVELVINYDVPQEEEYYVHRIGRTGRIGRKGMAFTFVVGKEIYRLKDIERYINSKITLGTLPSYKDVAEIREKGVMEKIIKILDSKEFNSDSVIIDKLVSDEYEYTAMDIAKALYTLMSSSENNNSNNNSLTGKENKFSGSGKKENNNNEDASGYKAVEGEMQTLFLSLGKKDDISVKDIVGAVAGNSGIDGQDIGKIDVHNNYSFIEVPSEYVKKVMTAMKNKTIKKKPVNIEISDKR